MFLAGTGAVWAAVPVRPRNFLSDALGAHLAVLRSTPVAAPAPGPVPAQTVSPDHLLPRARVLLLLAHALRADHHLLTLPLRRGLRDVAHDLSSLGPAATGLGAEVDAALRQMGFD